MLCGRVEGALDDVARRVEGDGRGQLVESQVAQVVAAGDAAVAQQAGEALGRAEGQHGHARDQPGADARGGILDHQAVSRGQPQGRGGKAEQVGVGLVALDAVAVGHGGQPPGNAQPLQHRPGVLAGRGDGVGDGGGVEGVQQGRHAGQQVVRADAVEGLLVVALLAGHHRLHALFGLRPAAQDN